MSSDDEMAVPGPLDPKPYKLWRVKITGEQIERVAEFATENEARGHKRLLDWHYALYCGFTKIPEFP